MPYKRLESNFVPCDYMELGKFAATRTILHCFENCSYHRPDLAPKQFGIVKVDESKLEKMIEIHVCSLKGPRVGKDFLSYTRIKPKCNYAAMGSVWERRMHSDLSHQIPAEPENEDQGTTQSNTHVVLDLENADQGPMKADDGDDIQQEEDVEPVIVKRNKRRKKPIQCDLEVVNSNNVSQSWLNDTSDIVGRRKVLILRHLLNDLFD